MEIGELKLIVLSVPKEVCDSAFDDEDHKNVVQKLLDEYGVDEGEGFGVKWWLCFLCRTQLCSVDMGDFKVAPKCGSRGCGECHQGSMYKVMQLAGEMVTTQSLYGLVLTPKEGRIRTHHDVKEFIKSVRRLLRDWERYYGLEYAFWVAECVVKWNEPRTEIPCPVRTRPLPAEKLKEKYPEERVEDLEHLVEACEAGEYCPYCQGHGYLPAVHLHVHVAISCEPFWYSIGPMREEDAAFIKQDFNGIGFRGFTEKHGLGVSKPQPLHSAAGAAQYLSKACIAYFSKGAQAELGIHLSHDHNDPGVECAHWDRKDSADRGDVDWNASQQGTMIAHAIYGSMRHRGKNGTAYGCTLKIKDATLMPRFSSEAVMDEFAGGMAGALRKGESCAEYVERKRIAKVAKEMERERTKKSMFVKALTIGKKRQEGLGFQYPKDTNYVLMKTQLDGDVNWSGRARASVGFLREHRGKVLKFEVFEDFNGGDDIGFFSEFSRKLDAKASHFVKEWDGAVCVKENEYWACLVKDYFLFGRGGTIFSLPLDCMARMGAFGLEWVDDRALEWLLLSLVRSEWKEWVAWQQYIIREKLFVGGRSRSAV